MQPGTELISPALLKPCPDLFLIEGLAPNDGSMELKILNVPKLRSCARCETAEWLDIELGLFFRNNSYRTELDNVMLFTFFILT